MADFEVTTEERSGEVRVGLSGELDLGAFDELDGLLEALQMNGANAVKVDLRGLTFIDSTGIRLLLRAFDRAQASDRAFCIVRGSPSIQRLFALTGLEGRLPFCEVDMYENG